MVVALLGDEAGREHIAALDETMQALPGFEDATLFAGARNEAVARMPRARMAVLARDDALARAGILRSEPSALAS